MLTEYKNEEEILLNKNRSSGKICCSLHAKICSGHQSKFLVQ
uniref:Uncharacterized protein n=1 Tax=Anguilla anguilla TaxID=7936 RepID=A0A0E9SJ48_ANGAN